MERTCRPPGPWLLVPGPRWTTENRIVATAWKRRLPSQCSAVAASDVVELAQNGASDSPAAAAAPMSAPELYAQFVYVSAAPGRASCRTARSLGFTPQDGTAAGRSARILEQSRTTVLQCSGNVGACLARSWAHVVAAATSSSQYQLARALVRQVKYRVRLVEPTRPKPLLIAVA